MINFIKQRLAKEIEQADKLLEVLSKIAGRISKNDKNNERYGFSAPCLLIESI